jgi:type IV pilus assembly protein PilM
MFRRKVWGIDLGRSAVKGVLVTPSGRGVKVLDADIVPFEGPPPTAPVPSTRDPRLWMALRKFQEAHRLDKTGVCITIPAHNTLVRDLTVASVGRKKIEEMVRFEASNEIPFVLDEVMWDYTLFRQAPSEPTRKGFLLAIKKTVIETYLRALQELDIARLDLITIAPLALLSFIRLEMGQEGRAMALDVGAQGTNLVVMDEGRFWMRSIQGGGDQVTAILQGKFELDRDAAEKAKLGLARSKLAARIVTALRPAMDELVRDVKTNLNFLAGAEDLDEVSTAYAVGGGSRLPGLRQLLSRSLRLKVRNIREVRHVVVSPHADVEFIRTNLDRLTVAVGTGIAGLRRDPDDVCFLPESYERATHVARWRRIALVVGLGIWLILLSLHGFGLVVQRKVHQGAEDFRKLATFVTINERKLETATAKIDSLKEELAFLLAIGSDKDHACELLDAVVKSFRDSSDDIAFKICSYECSEIELTRPKGHPGLLSGTVTGRMVATGATADTNYYERLTDMVSLLRDSLLVPPLVRCTAAFTQGSKDVVVKDLKLGYLVQEGDAIRPVPADGQSQPVGWRWYTIEQVSGTKLTLTREFAGASVEVDAVVVRVAQEYDDPAEHGFTVTFQVPRRPATALDHAGTTAPQD